MFKYEMLDGRIACKKKSLANCIVKKNHCCDMYWEHWQIAMKREEEENAE